MPLGENSRIDYSGVLTLCRRLLLASLEKVRFAVTVLEDNGHDTTRIDWEDSGSEASATSPMKEETEEKPTIFSQRIFSLVTKDKISDAVEDYILTDPNIQATKS